MNKRKVLLVLIIAMMVFVGCGKKESGDTENKVKGENGKVVIYTPSAEDIINTIIPAFEEETGIEVELVAATTGELLTRIKNESENPIADVMWGGSPSLIVPMAENFQEYTSVNEEFFPEEFKTVEGKLTRESMTSPVLLINTNLVGDEVVEGYQDLLNPKFKGQIAHGDSAGSSSAFNHLENMLFAMNQEDPMSKESWDFVEQFLENLDGKIVNSSGAIHKGVASGEYTIGLTWESAAVEYLESGAPVKVVYMDEGVIFKTSVSAVIKDAKNEENAKKFIDFLTSEKAQNLMGLETIGRPIRNDAKLADYKKPLSEIKIIEDQIMWGVENKDAVVEKYMELVTSILE